MKSHLPLLLFFISFVRSQSTWGYGPDNGPDTWPGLCNSGLRQSPLDLNPANYKISCIPEIIFVHYNISGNLNFANTGQTIMITGFEDWKRQPYIYGANLCSTYRLVQLHIHWAQNNSGGSEHTVYNIHHPVEIHFVHIKGHFTEEEAIKHSDGIVVVSVFAIDFPDIAPFEELAKYFTAIKNVGSTVELQDFNILSLLPVIQSSFYRYPGSLTTPPCSEAVEWVVMSVPISISADQLALLREIEGNDGNPQSHNNRPIQEFEGRNVLYRIG